MKSVLVLISALVSLSANATTLTCEGKSARSHGMGKTPVAAQFRFNMNGLNGTIVLSNLMGKVDFGSDEAYNFKIARLNNDAKYAPKKYKNSIRFQNVNGTAADGLSEDIGGDLIVSREADEVGYYDAHYIYQEEQNGGTIDLRCTDAIHMN